MYGRYQKVFIFRDCFDIDFLQGDIMLINDLISKGCTVCDGLLSVSLMVNQISVYKSEEDETLNICFNTDDVEVAHISLWDLKEVQLCFEIEEEVEKKEIILHYCEIKGFNDYQ